MRIKFVIGSLEAGGAQRVLILLSERLVKHGHEVTVLTINGTKNDCFSLPKRVRRQALNLWSGLQVLLNLPKLRAALRSSKPDVIVSFIDIMNMVTLLTTRGLHLPVVVSERSAPGAFEERPFLNWVRGRVYRFASRIIVQNQGALDYFLPRFREKLAIIPNPVVRPPEISSAPRLFSRPQVLAVGRLYEVKQFDRLIAAFAMIKDKHADWGLTIVGDGPLKRVLKKLGKDLELGDRLSLPGYLASPYVLLKQADLFVMSSRFEGFPNALCEAMACGLPVIATDCPTGPREVIRDGIDGLLVKNEDTIAISEAMDRLMSDEAERRRLASKSAEIIQRFDLERITQLWESVFMESIGSKKEKHTV